MVMSCNLNGIVNYAGKDNAAEIPNTNTAGFTYKLCQPASPDLLILDQSYLVSGATITNVIASVTDGTVILNYSGSENFVFDTTTLDLTKTWRIDYEIELGPAGSNSAPPVFFRPWVDYERVGTSDPNCPPLRDKNNFLATGSMNAVCYTFVQAVPALTWNVPHNQGLMYPCGWSIISPTNDTMFGNVKPVDANNLQVIFGLALAGRITLTF
jgi:hypothetical protein